MVSTREKTALWEARFMLTTAVLRTQQRAASVLSFRTVSLKGLQTLSHVWFNSCRCSRIGQGYNVFQEGLWLCGAGAHRHADKSRWDGVSSVDKQALFSPAHTSPHLTLTALRSISAWGLVHGRKSQRWPSRVYLCPNTWREGTIYQVRCRSTRKGMR